jgi:hypothetical protein
LGVAGTFLTALQNSNVAFQGQDKAYTVIVSQSISVVYFAKVCALYYAYDQAYNLGVSVIWGQSLLLQIR